MFLNPKGATFTWNAGDPTNFSYSLHKSLRVRKSAKFFLNSPKKGKGLQADFSAKPINSTENILLPKMEKLLLKRTQDSSFNQKVWKLCQKIPRGKVTTYKILGDKLRTKAYRAVGQALKRNPYAPEVPCHRVVASDGRLGGFMGKRMGRCLSKKVALLQKEGIRIQNGKIENFEQTIWY